jgi:membrane protein YdbS with pleckstrin-like domain
LAGRRFSLHPTEEVLVDIAPHWSFLAGPLAVALAAISIGIALDVGIPHTSVTLHWVEGVVVAVPCLWLAARVVRWRRTRFVLTTARIVVCWGALSQPRFEVGLAEIARVDVVQSLIRRVVGTGRIELVLWENGEVREIDDVRKPLVLRRVITRRLRPPS